MAKREPLAAPASGSTRLATIDGTTYRLTVTKHTAPEASAPWRKPRRWTTASVVRESDGRAVWGGTIQSAASEKDILRMAGLLEGWL